MQEYEKMGAFYLGRLYDPQAQKSSGDLLLYDSQDLVTHALCVGMTGSGKTGLCVALLEEAGIDSIPAIVIDPKGDLANLMLTFPGLKGEDFQPWVSPDEAAKKNLGVADYAQQQAQNWLKGMADWGQTPERIQRLRDKVEVSVYTPGSTAGLPISILKSFAAPGQALLEDAELYRERISVTVTSLLGLLGIDADPLQSREHILLSNLLDHIWKQGQDLDLAQLIQLVQTPPFAKVGVLDLDAFYPTKERFSLVMALNNLLAAPGFATWMEGEALEIPRLLHTAEAKPRISIFSISHLSDAERMFFVSLLLNEVLGWVRTQPGTSSLRALLYMDEIFGYFPPVANPPSKKPLLSLLKQARAFGLGVVLATQNPVDLDYKGLSNIGTWFIGRLQTERDKARILEGLEGASASAGQGFDRSKTDEILSGLGQRVFLMNNVHEDAPVVFQTRWALSYLAGPLKRDQIKALMDPLKSGRRAQATPTPADPPAAPAPPPPPIPVPAQSLAKPSLPSDIPQVFIPVKDPAPQEITVQPMILGAAKIAYEDAKTKVDFKRDVAYLAPVADLVIPVSWESCVPLGVPLTRLMKSPKKPCAFLDVPPPALVAKNYATWTQEFVSWIEENQKAEILFSPGCQMYSNPGEEEWEFRTRLKQNAREDRDGRREALKRQYAPKLAQINDRIQRAEMALAREKVQAREEQLQTAISMGSTILGAVLGRKRLSSATAQKAATVARGISRSAQQTQDVKQVNVSISTLKQEWAELNNDFERDMAALESSLDPLTEPLDKITIKPKKNGITVQLLALAWVPA